MSLDTHAKKIIKKRVTAAMLLAVMAAFALLSPALAEKLFDHEDYSDWLKTETEPKACIINVWHIVGFKPYIGSIGAWLNKRADEYRKSLIGIHFSVVSLTPEQAETRLKRGMTPDILSFPAGFVQADALMELKEYAGRQDVCAQSGTSGGELYALPYCASGRVLVFDPNKFIGIETEEIAANVGTFNEFKKGKASACICDLKEAGDLYRAGLAGGAPLFDAVPFNNEADEQLVQFIGINIAIEEHKLKYAKGFIGYITGAEAQGTLCELGLLPAVIGAKADYEQKWLSELQSRFDVLAVKNCFESEERKP